MLTSSIMKHMSLHLFGLVFFLPFGCAVGYSNSCAKISPDSEGHIPVELEKEFKAVCTLREDSVYTAHDITWFSGNVTLPRKSYTKLNKSALAVTLKISNDISNPLMCKATKQAFSYEEPCTYGIYLDKGYPPLQPSNLRCTALQYKTRISSKLSCSWDPGKRDPIISTSYTLHAHSDTEPHNITSKSYLEKNLTVDFGTYPNHGELMVWVEARNKLGAVNSSISNGDSERFVQPSPPKNVNITAEDGFPTSLMVTWEHPLHDTILKLRYHIRYWQAGCSVWNQTFVKYRNSFRLQTLQPYTDYVVQVRCIGHTSSHEDLGHWSDWSPNATVRTPEDIPSSKPDLWRVYEEDSDNTVKLIWKDPEKANGKILGYDVTIDEGGHSKHSVTHSKEHNFILTGDEAIVKITANNSQGASPAAILIIPRPGRTLCSGVKQVNCSVRDGQLLVSWTPLPGVSRPSEYVIEWVSVPKKEIGWQRVPGRDGQVSFGGLKEFTRYNITVYPIYREKKHSHYCPGTPVTVQAYLRQGAPRKSPTVNVSVMGKTTAQLKWNEIPIEDQQGFLTNYTVVCIKGNNTKIISDVVPSHTTSYNLTKLASDSQYCASIIIRNQVGSSKGSDSCFRTNKYDDGEMEVIVVVVCLSFLFFVLFVMFFVIRKKELLKRRFWPKVPDPSHSTLANWSPDCPSKSDTPKESILASVSVVEVDMDDGKSLCDEDKAVMPLKKYFSDERSSGISGSSGMSTPRQSVSSNDEADSGQTTASTVQYSAVVSSGYKGQTPSTQPFSRSESTQPLLECEENPEHMSEASSHHTDAYFKRCKGLEQLNMDEVEEPSFGSLSFNPMEEEDSPTLTEDPPRPAPSYMPQQSGYRPQ